LWSDLKAATKTEFESEIAKLQEVAKAATEEAVQPPPSARARHQAPRAGNPAARIAHHLTGKLDLGERDAINALTAELREKGIDAAKIPDASGQSLNAWLEALLDRVSGAVVMGAAHRVEPDR
jgi:hypothetical protein